MPRIYMLEDILPMIKNHGKHRISGRTLKTRGFSKIAYQLSRTSKLIPQEIADNQWFTIHNACTMYLW